MRYSPTLSRPPASPRDGRGPASVWLVSRMITVRLPPSLRIEGRDTLALDDDVRSIPDLIEAIDRRVPGVRELFDEGGCTLAVNDELVLHGVRDRTLRPGDVVEIVPTIAGGQIEVPGPFSRRRQAPS